MRTFIVTILTLLCLNQVTSAQTLSKLHWTYVQIPDDSLQPYYLTFYDSLHGYLGAGKTTYDATYQFFYFETTDGGKSWVKITDTLLSNTYVKDSVLYLGTSGVGANHNSPIVYADLKSRYVSSQWPRQYPKIYSKPVHSSDYGKTWQGKAENATAHYYPLEAFDPYNLVVYDSDSGIIRQTTNAGNTYSRLTDTSYMNTLYHKQLDPNYGGYNELDSYWGTSLDFDNSDRFHWTVTIHRGFYARVLHPLLHPMGLETLVTDNFGRTWKPYLTIIPGEDTLSRVGGTLQYIKDTPNLYYFTGSYSEGDRGYGSNNSIVDGGDAMLGINWMYSTDYGKSWEFYRQYGDTRRAFEAVKQNEVWITTRPQNSAHTYDAASVIARTTDNGFTWEEDIRTLRNDGLWDGRIITFSDPNHGWIAATDAQGQLGNHTYIFRYDASEQGNRAVEDYLTETNQLYLKIYPNPALSNVHFLLPANKPIQKVTFFSLLGTQVYPPYHLEGNLANVDVSNLPIGTYITRVTFLYKDYTGDFTLPFIVQH